MTRRALLALALLTTLLLSALFTAALAEVHYECRCPHGTYLTGLRYRWEHTEDLCAARCPIGEH